MRDRERSWKRGAVLPTSRKDEAPPVERFYTENLHPCGWPGSRELPHLAWWKPGRRLLPRRAGHAKRLERQPGLVIFLISSPAWGDKGVSVTQAEQRHWKERKQELPGSPTSCGQYPQHESVYHPDQDPDISAESSSEGGGRAAHYRDIKV